MIPILFDKNATNFSSHGIGDLMDCASCVIHQNDSGEYEGELKYPSNGVLFDQLNPDNIIVIKPNRYDPKQAFRIYAIDSSIDGTIVCKIQHISYDLNYYISSVYSNGAAIRTTQSAMAFLKSLEVNPSPFIYDGQGGGTTYGLGKEQTEYARSEYSSCRDILFNGDNSIKGFFENDVVFDNYLVKLVLVAGSDRGVTIEYGANLTDLRQEENLTSYYNGVVPYWFGKDPTKVPGYYDHSNPQGEFVIGPTLYAQRKQDYYISPYDAAHGSTVNISTEPFDGELPKPMALDLTEYFTSLAQVRMPTRSEIEEIAREWMRLSSLGIPEINITLTYVDDGSDVRLNDAVTVVFTKLGIKAKAKVVSYTYDVLLERYTEIELGSAKAFNAWNSLGGEKLTARSAFLPRMSRYATGTWG